MKINPSVLCSGIFQLKILENANCSQGIGTKAQLWCWTIMCSFLKLNTDFVEVKILFSIYRHREGNVLGEIMISLAVLWFSQVLCSAFAPPALQRFGCGVRIEGLQVPRGRRGFVLQHWRQLLTPKGKICFLLEFHLSSVWAISAHCCQTYPKSLGTFPPSVFLRDLCQEGRVGEKSCHVQIPCCLLPSLLPTMILEMNLFQARWNLCLLFFRLEWHFIRLFPKIRIIFGPWWAWSCRCVHCWVWLLLQRCCRNVLRENVIILGKICVWAVSVWCWEKDWAFLK